MNGLQAAMISGSTLILITLLLRAALRRRLPARLFPALWCVAAVRLLLPVSIPTHISIWNLLSSRISSPGGAVSGTLTAFPALSQSAASAASPDHAAQAPVLPLIWLSGALLLGLYFALGYAHSVKALRGSRLAPGPEEARLLALFGFSNRPVVCVSKNPRAPVTFGVVRPVVVLPEDSAVDCAQASLILAHELAHVRRKDCLRKLLLTVCLCVHFWNPLVWGMVVLANRDMELACDEKVLSVLGSGCKKQYALTLLSVAQRQQSASYLCSAFAKRPLEARIVSILNFRRMPVWTCVLAAAAFLLSACVLATQAAPSAIAAPEPVAVQQAQPELVKAISEPKKPAPDLPQNVSAGVPAEELPAQPPVEAAAEEAPEAAPAYIFPLENADAAVTDPYGWREHPLLQNGKTYFHSGVDLEAEAGSHILAVADGTVVESGYNEAYGYMVILEHAGGVQTFYAHMTDYLVSTGVTVRQGQIIGTVGSTGWSTGPHLHLGVMIDGESVDPLAALQSEA